jgi:hypothetical protein
LKPLFKFEIDILNGRLSAHRPRNGAPPTLRQRDALSQFRLQIWAPADAAIGRGHTVDALLNAATDEIRRFGAYLTAGRECGRRRTFDLNFRPAIAVPPHSSAKTDPQCPRPRQTDRSCSPP